MDKRLTRSHLIAPTTAFVSHRAHGAHSKTFPPIPSLSFWHQPTSLKKRLLDLTMTFFPSSGRVQARLSRVDDCTLLSLPNVISPSGSVTAMQSSDACPIHICRVYYLFDVPNNAHRGGHAHRGLHQILVAASGSFEVMLDDGHSTRTVVLNKPQVGLHIVPGIWRELSNFSSGSICLVLASARYEEADYLRSRTEFGRWKS